MIRVVQWATRDLRAGDLSALADVAKGSALDSGTRTERLRRRGFLARRGRTITFRGRLALLVWRFVVR